MKTDMRPLERALAIVLRAQTVHVRSVRLVWRESRAGYRRRRAIAKRRGVSWRKITPQRQGRGLCMCPCMERVWAVYYVSRGERTERALWCSPSVTEKTARTKRDAVTMHAEAFGRMANTILRVAAQSAETK